MKLPFAVFVSLDWSREAVAFCVSDAPRSSWTYGSKTPFADWMPNFASSSAYEATSRSRTFWSVSAIVCLSESSIFSPEGRGTGRRAFALTGSERVSSARAAGAARAAARTATMQKQQPVRTCRVRGAVTSHESLLKGRR